MWGYNYTPMPDELYHWKYIKREKINGKYRYWYADTEKSKKSNKIRFGKYLYTRDKNTGRNVLTKKDRRKQDLFPPRWSKSAKDFCPPGLRHHPGQKL